MDKYYIIKEASDMLHGFTTRKEAEKNLRLYKKDDKKTELYSGYREGEYHLLKLIK
jgi:hypothetical protein